MILEQGKALAGTYSSCAGSWVTGVWFLGAAEGTRSQASLDGVKLGKDYSSVLQKLLHWYCYGKGRGVRRALSLE